MKTNTFHKRKAIVFKRFSNKRWSLFAVLGKVVLVGVLTAPTLAHAKAGGCADVARCADPAGADPDTLGLGEQMLENVTVNGSRAPLTALQSAKIVEVITRDDINRAEAQSVNDILKLAAGVDVRQRGAFGVQTDISVNGGTFDQVSILLNGMPLTSPQTGHNAADFPVSLDDIDHIEVIQGAAARVFGSAAFSGAINIVTRQAPNPDRPAQEPWSAWMRAEGGSFGTVATSAGAANASWQTLANSLSAGFARSDGGTSNSDFTKWRAYYQGGFTSPTAEVAWQAGITSQDYGANTFYSARFPNQYEWTRRYMGSVAATIRPLAFLSVKPSVYAHRDVDHYQLTRDSVGARNGENFHRMDVYGAALDLDLEWALGKTAVGADIRKEHILSTTYGDMLPESQWKKIRNSDRFYSRRGDRTNTSLYLEHNVILGTLTVSAGLLANKNTGLDQDFRLYPGVDVSWRPSRQWKLYAGWNKAMRLPTFTDMYADNSAQRGDIALKPEKNSTFKIGARFRVNGFTALATAFHSHGTDMIDWVYQTEESRQYQAMNIGKLNNTGFTLDATFNLPSPKVVLHLGYAYIHQKHETSQPIFRSLYALEYLRHKFVATLSHPIVSHLSASWALRWQQRMNGYHPYAKLDGRLQWTARHYQLYISADNITAHRYHDLGGVLQPGLWMMGGVRVNL